jgi:hypothetical protein
VLRWTALFWHFFVLVLSIAVLVLVIDARRILSLLPRFDYEHRFTKHEHDNCVCMPGTHYFLLNSNVTFSIFPVNSNSPLSW